jgi:hypothetical protein
MGTISKWKMLKMHAQYDPSLQPSQLLCKNAREIKIKTQNPKLRKNGKNFGKSHTLGLIRNVNLKSF